MVHNQAQTHDQNRELHRLEHWVHWSLLGGLACGGLLLASGLTLTLGGNEPRPEGAPPAVGSLIRMAVRGDGVALMDLGLLALMATPILRVVVLSVGWGAAGDRRFAAVALVVLGLLGLSLALGFG